MKTRYRVHTTHDTQVAVAAKTEDGREVVAMVPAVTVELVPVAGGRVVTLDVVTASPEEHAKALVEYGFGAEVDLGIESVSVGLTPKDRMALAAAAHVVDARAAHEDALAGGNAEAIEAAEKAHADLSAALAQRVGADNVEAAIAAVAEKA